MIKSKMQYLYLLSSKVKVIAVNHLKLSKFICGVLRRGCLVFVTAFYCVLTYADDFKMNCDVQGTIPVLQDKAYPQARVSLVIQTLGSNIFIQLVGPSPYDMKVSTLTTKIMTGTNFTNAKHIGVRAKNKETGQQSEIVIDQKSVGLSGYNDIEYQNQYVRLVLTGQCILPK